MSTFKILEYGERADSLWGIENKEITELELEALLEGKRLWTDINWEYAITIRLKDRLKELELDKEIERLNKALLDIKENINKKLCPNSDYVDYDFGAELLRQELLDIVNKTLGSDKE